MIILQNHLMWKKWRYAFRVFYTAINAIKLAALIVLLAVVSVHATELSYDSAMEVKKSGDFSQAEALFNQLIAKDKNNAGLWFQLGLTQRFQNKKEEAMITQKHALTLAPENNDIRLELARLHAWNKEYDTASPMVDRVLRDTPDYQEAQDLKAFIERGRQAPAIAEDTKWQMDFGYENSGFSKVSRDHWHQYFTQIGRWVRDDTLLHFRFENHERFDEYNQHYEIGISHIFNDDYNFQISVGYTPDSLFIPEWRFKACDELRIISDNKYVGNTWLTGCVRHDRYDDIDITIINPGIRYHINDSWHIQAHQITVFDEHDDILTGWSVRADWQTPISELRLFGGLSDAPETEDTDTVDTTSYFLGFAYQCTPKVTLHTSYAREDREDAYIRNIVTTALSVKF